MNNPAPGRHEFTVSGSELLLQSPILALRRDHVVMPGGGLKTREVVEHFGAVAIAAVDERGRVALIRQYRHSVGTRLLELPAGLLDVDGENALAGAQRELVEEAGLEAAQWSVLADLVTSPGFCDEACRIYLATELNAVTRPVPEGDEETDLTVEWMNLSHARAMILRGEITNSIAVAGIFAASEVLSRGGSPRPVSASFDLRPRALAQRRRADGVTPDMKKI